MLTVEGIYKDGKIESREINQALRYTLGL